MNCPYCNFHFDSIRSNSPDLPPVVPGICADCVSIFLLDRGKVRRVSEEELASIQASPAYHNVIEPAIKVLLAGKKEKVN